MHRTDSSGGTSRHSRAHLAAGVAALGLATTWSAASAQSATATATIEIKGAVSLFADAATVTITSPAFGGDIGDLNAGTNAGVPVKLPPVGEIPPDGRYSFLGSIDNGDGTSDLVMSFPGDGSVADGVVWTSLFVDGLPDEQRVFEPQVLQQLASPPVFDQAGRVEPGSQIGRLDEYYRDLTGTSYGQSATLIAFNGPGNTGVVVGSIIITPAPGAVGMIGIAAVAGASRRRRA